MRQHAWVSGLQLDDVGCCSSFGFASPKRAPVCVSVVCC